MSYEIDRRIEEGSDFDKLLSSYDKLVKAAEFTPKNVKNINDFDTFGEAMAAANAYIDAHCNKINESFVQEWWGQTDEIPTNFAKNYNLKILSYIILLVPIK